MGVGIDILELKKFQEAIENGGQSFLNKHFTASEMKQNTSSVHLAGIFSVKESIMKTGFLPQVNFLQVQIINNDSGKPAVYDINGNIIEEVYISISHSGETVVSMAIWNQ